MLPFGNHVHAPPLGLAYLKGYVARDPDILVRIVDLEKLFFESTVINKSENEYFARMSSSDTLAEISPDVQGLLDQFIDLLLAEHADALGFSVTNYNRRYTDYVAQKIKSRSPSTYIIYGGRTFCFRKKWRYQVTALHKHEFPFVDCIVKNEGEETLREVVDTLKNGTVPRHCLGTSLKIDDTFVDCGDRPPISDIDTIPFPYFSDYDRSAYLGDFVRIKFNRGCPGVCEYCVDSDEMGERVRIRNPEQILAEIQLRIQEGYRKFQVSDLCANASISQIERLCELIIAAKLDVEFIFAQFRHSPLLTQKTFTLLKKAGFTLIAFGTESFSQSILNAMKKGVRIETIGKNLKDAHTAGLPVMIYLMVGYPGETEATFQESISFITKHKAYISGVGHVAEVVICPGSGIHEHLECYRLNQESLFRKPDIWESADKKSTLEWRLTLVSRMQKHLDQSGISLMVHAWGGTPSFPQSKLHMLPKTSTFFKRYISLLAHPITKVLSLKIPAPNHRQKIPYSARIIQKKLIAHKNSFMLKIKNTGKETWMSDHSLRVGCRVYAAQDPITPVLELRQAIPEGGITPGSLFHTEFIFNKTLSPGMYLFKFDLVVENKFWFEDKGSSPLTIPLQVT